MLQSQIEYIISDGDH